MAGYLIRYGEYEYYDPMTDQSMVRLTATEANGTWYADVPEHDPRGQRRREFKAQVQAAIIKGWLPGPIIIERSEA